MICIEVRRNLLADPCSDGVDIISHIEGCESCATFKRSMQVFDHRLFEAMNTPVPDELPARILLKHHHAHRQQGIKRRILGLSLAATLLLSVGTIASLSMLSPVSSLGEIAIAHVNSELEHLKTKQTVNLSEVNRILATRQLKISQAFAKVNFIGMCSLERKSVVHIVLEGKAGPVTLLLIQGKRIDTKETIRDRRFKGIIVPGIKGNIAIIGEQDERISDIEHQLLPLLQTV